MEAAVVFNPNNAGGFDHAGRVMPTDAENPSAHHVLEAYKRRRSEAASEGQEHCRKWGYQYEIIHGTLVVGRKKASRSRSDLNSLVQFGHSQRRRRRSLPLEIERTLNSLRYQIQAQLPDTSIPHFLHRSFFRPPIQIFGCRIDNPLSALFSRLEARNKFSMRV